MCFFLILCDGCSSCLTNNALIGVQAAGLKLQITLHALSLSKCKLDQQVCAKHLSRMLSIVTEHIMLFCKCVYVCVCVFNCTAAIMR